LFHVFTLEELWEREIVLIKYGNHSLLDIFQMSDKEIDYKIPKIIELTKKELEARRIQL
jgi:hypothetical protein